jgi:hypothetical protein
MTVSGLKWIEAEKIYGARINWASLMYVIHAKSTIFYKVGISKNPISRLSELQTGCPFKLILIGTWYFREPSKMEKYIHLDLKKSGVHERGEWFRFEEKEINEFKKELNELSHKYKDSYPYRDN